MEFSNWKCFPAGTEVPPKSWLKKKSWVEVLLKWGTSFSVWVIPLSKNHHRKELFYLELGCTPNISKVILPETPGVFLFQYHSTRAPNPKTSRAGIRRWEESLPLLAGTLKFVVVNVCNRLVSRTDHSGSLPEPDSTSVQERADRWPRRYPRKPSRGYVELVHGARIWISSVSKRMRRCSSESWGSLRKLTKV